MRDYFLTKLLGIQGWYVKDKKIVEENGQRKVILDIEREGSTIFVIDVEAYLNRHTSGDSKK